MKIESDKKGLFWKREKKFKVTDWGTKAKPILPLSFFDPGKFKLWILQVDGGGMLGILVLFALYVLELMGLNIRKLFKVYWGTSTGAIIVWLIVLGYSIKEILEIYITLGPEMFNQKSFLGGVFSGSLYKKNNIKKIFEDKGGNYTFLELYEKTGLELNVCVVNVTDDETEVWNYKNHPNDMVRIAVLFSMSAIIFFDLEEYKGKLYGDGGMGTKNCLAEKAINDAFFVKKLDPKDVFILSMGCGKGKRKLPKRNLLSKALWVVKFGRKDSTVSQEKTLEYRKQDVGLNYYRFNLDLSSSLDKMDNTDNIDKLIALMDKP